MKEIKSGSFVLSFTLDETYYWLRMIKEEENIGSEADKNVKFKVECQAGGRKVTLSKIIIGNSAPEYNMEGEGMDREEMLQFLFNWKAIVAQEIVTVLQDPSNIAIESTLLSFLDLIDHFFGNRIKDILENGDPEDEDDDIVTSSSDDSGDDLSISKMSDIIDGENIK